MTPDAPPRQEREPGANPEMDDEDGLLVGEGMQALWALLCQEEQQESLHWGLRPNVPRVSHVALCAEGSLVPSRC